MNLNVIVDGVVAVLAAAFVPLVVVLWRLGSRLDAINDLVLGDEKRGIIPLAVFQKASLENQMQAKDQVARISREVLPNGGSSMKDSLLRTEQKLDEHLRDAGRQRAEYLEDMREIRSQLPGRST